MAVSRPVRALIVTSMYPTPEHPARGRFVYDQVRALRDLGEVELEVEAFAPGGASAYAAAGARILRRYRGRRFEIVHAHFGLTAWPSLAVRAGAHVVTLHGTDLAHPRSRAITVSALPLLELTAAVSSELAASVPRWASRGRAVAVLPCGVDLGRFSALDRDAARAELGLERGRRWLLFPADPARPEKRFDRARELADAAGAGLLTLGEIDPERVPLYVNAADAVLVTSEREGFGLAVLEALACDVPVLATPCGIAPEALAGLEGTYCGPYSLERWRAELSGVLAGPLQRVRGRERAERYSASAAARRVLEAWRALL